MQNDVQENTNIRLMGMTKTIQDLRMKFNQEIKTLARTGSMKVNLKIQRLNWETQRKASQVG